VFPGGDIPGLDPVAGGEVPLVVGLSEFLEVVVEELDPSEEGEFRVELRVEDRVVLGDEVVRVDDEVPGAVDDSLTTSFTSLLGHAC